MLSTWIKGITGHNNLAYFQSKLNTEIDPTCRLCLQANETLHHLMTDCEATTSLQLDIMKNKIPVAFFPQLRFFLSCVFSSVAFFPRTEKERREKRPQTCCEKIREQSFLIAKENIA